MTCAGCGWNHKNDDKPMTDDCWDAIAGKRFTPVINGEIVAATHFAWDGCHKIYLINTDADRSLMDSYGWESSAYLPIEKLPQAWEDSCSLRFISWADLTLPNLVNQFDENVTVEVRVT